jgi:uncharacterized iron-regulated membrane protein
MTRSIVRQIHLWLGLILCVPLLLLGLTGSILVFEDELSAAFSSRQPVTPGDPKPVSAIIAAARAGAPAGAAIQGYIAPAPGGLAIVRFSKPRTGDAAAAAGPGDGIRVSVDPVSLSTSANEPEGFFRQVANLHTNLLMKNRDGRQLVGWLGVVMLGMGISGLVNWFPRLFQWRNGSWRQAFAVRRGGNGFRFNRELHGAAGIWGLIVFIVVTFGGIQLAFPETVRGIVNVVMPARDLRAAAGAIKVVPQKGTEPMPVDDAVALARSEVPNADLRFVFMPARPDQPIRIAFSRIGQDRREPTVTVFVDPWTRKIAATQDPRQYSAGETLLAWQHALHAGQGLGFVWKFLVFFCGFLPVIFSITGVAMWWLKRRGRMAPAAAEPGALMDPAYTARRAGE